MSSDRPLVITAPGGGTYTGGLTVDGHAYDNDWLTFAELAAGGALAYRTGTTPGTGWAAGPAPAPSAYCAGDEGQPRAFRLIRMPAGFPGARLPAGDLLLQLLEEPDWRHGERETSSDDR